MDQTTITSKDYLFKNKQYGSDDAKMLYLSIVRTLGEESYVALLTSVCTPISNIATFLLAN